MSGKTYLITGGNRGIGFELVKKLSNLNQNNTVIATTRNPKTSIDLQTFSNEHPNVHIVELDVSSLDSIKGLDEQLSSIAKDGIDVFVSNAGLGKLEAMEPVLKTDWDMWLEHYTTNSLGPVFVTQQLHPYLNKKDTKQIVFITSLLGALNEQPDILCSAYGQSKAALNHTAIRLSKELPDFTIVAVHPGLVSTEMGNTCANAIIALEPNAKEGIENMSITPDVSGEAIAKIINGLTTKDTGKFFNYDGAKVSW